MIIPAQVPSTGAPPRTSSRSGSARPSREIARDLGAEVAQGASVRGEVALEGEDPDQRVHRYQPRLASS